MIEKFVEVKDKVNNLFTPRDRVSEPYRTKMQRVMNVMKHTNLVALGAGAANVVATPVLILTGQQEALHEINRNIPYAFGAYMALNLGCVARIGMLEAQNSGHSQGA